MNGANANIRSDHVLGNPVVNIREDGIQHQSAMPNVAQPESLTSFSDLFAQFAEKFNVSREVILRKYLDKEVITNDFYNKRVAEWDSDAVAVRGGGGSYYYTVRTYLGETYMQKAFGKYYQNSISREQLASYLGTNVKNISGLEALVSST